MRNERRLCLTLPALAFVLSCGTDRAPDGKVHVSPLAPPAEAPPAEATKLCMQGDAPRALVDDESSFVDQSIAVDRDYVYFTGWLDPSTGEDWVMQRVLKTGGRPERVVERGRHVSDGV